MYNLIIKDKFEAAHYLPDYDGNCSRLHGHSWKIDIEVRFNKIQSDGMGIDFKDLALKEMAILSAKASIEVVK